MFHGFVRGREGKFTNFEASGADATPGNFIGTEANAINDAGAIAGVYYDVHNVAHGFLRSPEGKVTTFDPPGSTATIPIALNSESAIVGYYVDKTGVFGGFLRRADGCISDCSLGLNDWGAITGAANVTPKAAWYWMGTFPVSINDDGVVTGYYIDANNVSHVFLLFPSDND